MNSLTEIRKIIRKFLLEDYTLKAPEKLKAVGFLKVDRVKLGGYVLLENDQYGHSIGADFLCTSGGASEPYVIKPYKENQYLIQDNPLFWKRYLKLNPEKKTFYFLNENDKWNYQGKYQGVLVDKEKHWALDSEYDKFFYKIEKMKQDGAVFVEYF